MSVLQLSKTREEDLLECANNDGLDVYEHQPAADKKNLEAPQMAQTVVPHELLADGSRMQPKLENYLNAQRMLFGNAQAEQLLMELNCASQINRGPDGVFESSRLHWDMLLNRDEAIYPSDYLNFDAKMKR